MEEEKKKQECEEVKQKDKTDAKQKIGSIFTTWYDKFFFP